jgi:hypothetical protein
VDQAPRGFGKTESRLLPRRQGVPLQDSIRLSPTTTCSCECRKVRAPKPKNGRQDETVRRDIVLVTYEWSPLEPKVTEEKDYALDVGLSAGDDHQGRFG